MSVVSQGEDEMDEQRRAKWTKQTAGLHVAIGRFVVSFEHVCHAMSLSVLVALRSRGLRDEQLGLALLADLNAARCEAYFYLFTLACMRMTLSV